MKVAIAGVGGMGGAHFNIYKSMKDAELIAACDVRLDMLKEKAAGLDIHLYDNFDEMLKNEKPDLIDISTPTYLHTEQTIKALQSGANVICEKPMALSSEQTQKILEAAKQSGKLFMTAHVVRFMNAYIYLSNIIKSGKYGKLLRLDMTRYSQIPMWSYENWMQDKSKSGHVVLDMMIHDIDFMQNLFGSPEDINGVYYDLKDLTNYASVNYIYDGFSVCVETGWYKADIPFNAGYRAVFENGGVELKDGKVFDCGSEISFDDENKIGETGINISNVDGYEGEIAYFMDCIKKGIHPDIVTPESSAYSVKLVEETLAKLRHI